MREGHEGIIALGVFQALCQVMGTLSKEIRKSGFLSNSDGSGMDMADIREITRMEPADLDKGLELLKIAGWVSIDLQRVKDDPATSAPPPCHLSATSVPKDSGFVKGEGEGEGEVPPNPLKGEWDIFPKGCFSKSKTDQKRIKVIYNNPKMVFIGKWFGRCEKTLWSVSEAKALMDLNLTREEVELMGVYRNTEDAFHRKGVQSLLNNWSGELDKARAIKKAATSPKPTTQGPDGWEEEWKKLYPGEDSAPGKWSWVDDGAQEQIKEILKK